MYKIFQRARFLKAARDACEKAGQVYTFRCTKCGCPAKATKSARTGRVSAKCTECGLAAME